MKYMLFCLHCTNKVFTDGKDLNFLAEVQLSDIPKRWDGKDKSVFKQRRKFKCDKCGYIFKIVELPKENVEPKDKKESDIV